MSLLSMLGINLPGLGSGASNPFGGLVDGGVPAPPVVGGGFQTLLPLLAQALQGKLGTQLPGPISPTGQAQYPGQTVNPQGGEKVSRPKGVQPPAMFIPPTGPQTQTQPQTSGPQGWAPIRAGIFKGESGGDPNTLYGHVEQKGPFAGTKVTGMTVDQVLAFSAPNGPYGQWARSHGITAAPMGSYQIIHSTLRDLVKPGMGLTGNEIMTPELQEKMGQFIYSKQGTGAWAGYKGPADPAKYGTIPQSQSPTYDAMSRPSGSFASAPAGGPEIGGGFANTGLAMDPGEYNTKTNAGTAHDRSKKPGGGGAKDGDGGGSSGGGAHQNSVSSDYKRYQARKNVRHLRGLSPVATIQALADIGKGLRTQGGGQV